MQIRIIILPSLYCLSVIVETLKHTVIPELVDYVFKLLLGLWIGVFLEVDMYQSKGIKFPLTQ